MVLKRFIRRRSADSPLGNESGMAASSHKKTVSLGGLLLVGQVDQKASDDKVGHFR